LYKSLTGQLFLNSEILDQEVNFKFLESDDFKLPSQLNVGITLILDIDIRIKNDSEASNT